MAKDALGVLQAEVTKTASFNGAGYDLTTGTPDRGIVALVNYSAASNATGANSVTFSVEHSDDDSTYYALSSGAADVINLTTTAAAGEIFIPFRTDKRYVRLVATVAGGGTVPTVTYSGHITYTKP